jgi:HSP20 family molecular chaperone IbpA
MRCRHHHSRYALFIQSQRSYRDDWLSKGISMIVAKAQWSPSADVYETNEKIYITLELAGADPEKLEIALYEDGIVIEGKRFLPSFAAKGMYHMAEIRQGPFSFELPLSLTVKPKQIESQYENGLLSIIIKKHIE